MKGRLMSVTTKKLQRGLGLLLLAAGSLASVSCDENGGDDSDGGMSGGLFPDLAKSCGLTCPAAGQGVAYGNASISGYGPIDSFFRSVINYNTTASGVAASIDLELKGIQALFGITDAELSGKTLGAAIKAKIDAQASIVVNTTPAQCSVDAKVAAQASASCQAEAKCNINPGMASFNCMGTCEVEANVQGQCQADAQVQCEVTAPDFQCSGSCSGSCEVTTPVVACNAACSGSCSGSCVLDVPTVECAGSCSGSCGGSCSGECAGGTKDANGVCSGTCMGTCTGQCSAGCTVTGQAAASCKGTCMGSCSAGCQVTGEAALNCQGKCNGTCKYTKPSAGCDARADIKCELKGSAAAMCSGSCDGDFEPPSANCDASASCQASAKAEARFQVKCTPPRVEVKIVAKANATVGLDQVNFWIAELGARLPRLSAAVGRARIVNEAGAELATEGRSAVTGTISAVGSGKVGFVTAAKIVQCTPAGLNESGTVIAQAKATLDASANNAASVATTFGMLM
jgi:hypothetical protein